MSTANVTTPTEDKAAFEHRLKVELAAAERRLAELARHVLDQPPHLIDAADAAAWGEIRDDSNLSAVLVDWTDRLVTEDPSFLRRVFEGYERWLRDGTDQRVAA